METNTRSQTGVVGRGRGKRTSSGDMLSRTADDCVCVLSVSSHLWDILFPFIVFTCPRRMCQRCNSHAVAPRPGASTRAFLRRCSYIGSCFRDCVRISLDELNAAMQVGPQGIYYPLSNTMIQPKCRTLSAQLAFPCITLAVSLVRALEDNWVSYRMLSPPRVPFVRTLRARGGGMRCCDATSPVHSGNSSSCSYWRPELNELLDVLTLFLPVNRPSTSRTAWS